MNEQINVHDDGVTPLDKVKIVISTTETKEITTTDFDGTLSDLENETLPHLYKQRDSILAEIARYEALKDKVQTEVDKLPPREIAVEEVVEEALPE